MEVCEMTEVELDRKEFLQFLSSFGETEDLKIVVSENSISAEVGFSTHYLKKSMAIEAHSIKTEGEIDISDLKKLVSFCKKINKSDILLRQMGSGKTLYVNGGSTKLQLPTSNTIISHTKTPLINKLIDEAKESMWTTWTPQKLEISAHGDISVSELLNVAKMKDIVGKHGITVSTNADESEFAISMGKKHTPRIFSTLNVSNAQGPMGTVESNFGHWFTDCLSMLEESAATFHMGESLPLIIEQENTLLIIIQEA
jgi:hypothetical protein